jgi:alkanesulfonate monooxygenase SsuD/methylene tetrahydromethanopterin reductase-like flavin-dependent oxidoreductase (luciferase family)
MRAVMIGVGLDARLGLSFGQLREMAQEASRLGFQSLWSPYVGVPDAFHVCAAWGQDTGLRTGISVVPAAFMWTPSALAQQAATVAQLAAGGFVLGLGTGGVGREFWAAAGLPDRPVAVMRKYATAVRDLLAGQAVSSDGLALGPRDTRLRTGKLPPVPLYLAALGPQMLRLAGEVADGALLNWATPERIAASRVLVGDGASRAGRAPGSAPLTMYVRVCIDDDVAAARRAFGTQALSYAMTGPGMPKTAGYRGMFGQMGFDAVLNELEERRDRGTPLTELVDAAPDELLQAVGYYGQAPGAPSAYRRLSAGLDESVVRIITVRPGPGPVLDAMSALTPAAIEAA